MMNKNKIPVKLITDQAIQSRVEKHQNTPIDAKTKKKVKGLFDFMNRMQSSNLPVTALVSRFYSVVDTYMNQIHKFSVCRKACGCCCRQKVDISLLEAAYIQKKTGIAIKDNPGQDGLNMMEIKTYCPFLDQETELCKVYEFRPLVCRTYAVFDDPALCSSKNKQHQHTTSVQPFLVSISENLIENGKDIARNNNAPVIADIRDYF